MKQEDVDFFDYRLTPFRQLLLCFGIMILLVLVLYMASLMKITTVEKEDYWICFLAPILFFVVMNCVVTFFSKEHLVYYRESLMSYIILTMLACLGGWIITGINILDLVHFKFVLIVITFVFLVFLSIINLMKWIMKYILTENETGRK